ncbi:MAG: nucleotidyltransferase domain-containing protein [Candidatus Melainabacteria bacterium]|nr:nucleotidyltransferase domain-containing protein [Candidatus Melainabacteria bacterium]
MNFGLDQKTSDAIKELFSKYSEIQAVKIYGSRAMDNFKYNSDIDFAIIDDFTWDFTSHIYEEPDQLPIPFLFDVTDYNRITNKDLKDHVDCYFKSS